MKKLLMGTAGRAADFLGQVNENRVYPEQANIDRLADLEIELPTESMDPESVLELLSGYGSPSTVGTVGGRYFGFVIGGVLPAALAANWMAGAWDQNAFSSKMAPFGLKVEKIAAKWLLDVLNLPAGSAVSFATGATMANYTALTAARRHVLATEGWDVESRGLFGAPEIKVVVSKESHPTVLKALGMLGLGRERVTFAPVDNQGCVIAEEFPEISGPAIVCLQAGNVNTGAFDPVGEICAKVKKPGVWIHVDGAFGLWAGAAPDRSYLIEGLNKADSWATDAHKWLNTAYDSGLAFVRHPEDLYNSFSVTASYLPEEERFTPESSRRARGIDIWAALLSLGRSGLADLIERTCRYASRFAEGLSKAGYEILNDVVLNQVLVSFGDAETTKKIIGEIQEDGTCWCGGTVWQGKTAMRISVSSWATTAEDVEKSLETMIRIAEAVRG